MYEPETLQEKNIGADSKKKHREWSHQNISQMEK